MFTEIPVLKKVVAAGIAGMFALNSVNLPANAITKDELSSLSYMQVKGTGLAYRCPEVVGEQTINIAAGKKYKITELCLEPTSFQVSTVKVLRLFCVMNANVARCFV